MSRLLAPGAVEFDAVACCALERAGTQEVHQPFIQEYLAGMQKVRPTYTARTLLGIFTHTLQLTFIPDTVHRVLYSSLALAEIAVLEKSDYILLECGHLVHEHCEALDTVYANMKPVEQCH